MITPGQATSERARLELELLRDVMPAVEAMLRHVFGISGQVTLGDVFNALDILDAFDKNNQALPPGGFIDVMSEVQAGLQPNSELTKDEVAEKARTLTAAKIRTTVTMNYGSATLDQLAREGFTAKRWVSHHDELVRDSHLAADGQTVAISATFSVGTNALMYPADPSGQPGEVINCRCVMVGVDGEESFEEEWQRIVDSDGARLLKMADECSGTLDPDFDTSLRCQALRDWAEYVRAGFATHFEDIQAYLRIGQLPPWWTEGGDPASLHRGLDLIFDTYAQRFDRPITVFRGVKPNDMMGVFDPGEWRVGTRLNDRGFLSTTLNREVAEAYAGEGGQYEDPNWLLTMKLRTGQRWVVGNMDQSEILLPRGAQMRVIDIDQDKRTATLEVV